MFPNEQCTNRHTYMKREIECENRIQLYRVNVLNIRFLRHRLELQNNRDKSHRNSTQPNKLHITYPNACWPSLRIASIERVRPIRLIELYGNQYVSVCSRRPSTASDCVLNAKSHSYEWLWHRSALEAFRFRVDSSASRPRSARRNRFL